MTDPTILFEDSYIYIIDKPPGVVVNKAISVKGETIQDFAYRHLRLAPPETVDNPDSFIARAGIVHRLDKETSGVLILAKSEESMIAMQHLFADRQISKSYIAITHGALVPRSGEIRAPVGRLPWNRERFGILPDGKEAVTEYEVIKIVDEKRALESLSVVHLKPHTGRTHQIRVHLQYIRHPIVGDFLYAGRKVSRDDRLWCGRVLLHAFTISCIHPMTGKEIIVKAPIPADMISIVGPTPFGTG